MKKFITSFTLFVFVLFALTPFTYLLSTNGATAEGADIQVIDTFATPVNYFLFFTGLLLVLFLLKKNTINQMLQLKVHYFSLIFFYLLIVPPLFGNTTQIANTVIQLELIFTIFLIYQNFGLEYLMKITVYSFTGVVILSCIFAIFIPNYGVSIGIHESSWQGIFNHKNQFGFFVFCYTLLLIMSAYQRVISKFKFCMLIFLAIFCNIKSQSSTAIFLSFFSIILFVSRFIIPYGLQKLSRKLIFKILFLIVLYVLIMYSSDIFSSIFNKSYSGYSGRDKIWPLGIVIFLKHPLFGVTIDSGFSIPNYILDNFGSNVGSFHNSYIQSLASYGVLGSFFAFLPLLLIMYYKKGSDFVLTYIVFFPVLIYLFMENFYLGKYPTILLLILVYLSMCNQCDQKRVQFLEMSHA